MSYRLQTSGAEDEGDEGEIVGRISARTMALARPVETREQYEARMEREEAFVEVQTELAKTLLGLFGIPFRRVEDYYEAGLPTGAFALSFGKTAIEEKFIQERVLGETLSERIERYYITTPSDGKPTKKSKRLYSEYVGDFNPEVLYVAFTYPATMNHNGKEYNLFLLRKSALRWGERSSLIRRANALLEILGYSEEYYKYKNMPDPWKDVIQKIQAVSLRAEPMQDAEFGKTGRVIEWVKPSEYIPRGGMVVESPDFGMPVILTNAGNREKFGHLEGQLVRYQFKGYTKSEGIPYGELVATSLGIPIDDTPRLCA